MTIHRSISLLAVGAAAAVLIACGGSDDSAAPASAGGGSSVASPEGAYAGTITGGANDSFQLVVRTDGTYWALYGVTIDDTLVVSGFTQGSGTYDGTTYTSTDSRDFGSTPAIGAPLTATYGSGALKGTLAEDGSVLSFAGSSAAVAPYVYATAAKVSDVAGSWALSLLDGETAAVTVASSGTFSGTTSFGCAFTGTLTPDVHGRNVFDMALTEGAAPCVLPGQTANGIAIYSSTSTGVHQLIVAAVDSTRTASVAGFGQR